MNIINNEIYKDFKPLPLNVTGWNGNRPTFEHLITKIYPKHIIEVGTWKGQSAITMGRAIVKNNIPCKITCVDTWLGALEFWDNKKHLNDEGWDLQLKHGYPQVYYQFLSNVVHNNLQNIILPFPTTSFIAAQHFKKNKITADMIYIDASHEYEDVIQDCVQYWDIVNAEGVMFGDDWNCPGVRRAVEEFKNKNNLDITILESNFWCFKKV